MARKKFIIFSLFLSLLSFGYWVMADSQPKYLIKLATVAPDGSSWMKIMEDMDKELREKTKGEVGFAFYGGGRAGEEGAVLEKMRYMEYHAAGLTGIGLGSILPEIRVMESPFMFKTYKEYDHVLEKFTKRFWKGIYKRDYVLLGWAEGGFVNVFSKTKVVTLKELQQTNFWVRQGDPFLAGVFKGFGLKATPLALQDVLPMLQTGKIDTIGVSPLACIALQWHSELKYRSEAPIYNIMAGVVISKKAWTNLPTQYKRPLYKTVRKYSTKLVEVSRKDNEEAKKKLVTMGLATINPSPQQLSEWDKRGAEVADQMAKDKIFPKELLEQARDYLKNFRKK